MSDISDIGLCASNSHETYFNQILCHIGMGDYDSAI